MKQMSDFPMQKGGRRHKKSCRGGKRMRKTYRGTHRRTGGQTVSPNELAGEWNTLLSYIQAK